MSRFARARAALLLILAAVIAATSVTLFGASDHTDLAASASGSVAASPSGAQTLSVSTTGSDSDSGNHGSPLRTLDRALELARPGDLIELAPGAYQATTDRRRRSGYVSVQAMNAKRRPSIAGITLDHSSFLRMSRIQFTGPVYIGRASDHISISHSSVRVPRPLKADCLTIRSSSSVRVISNRMVDCGRSIGGPPDPTPSRDIVIRGNRLLSQRNDGIAFASWTNVRIENNLIDHIYTPPGAVNPHNDGIQLFGDAKHVLIARNRIYNSDSQLFLAQAAVIGPNVDVTIRDNIWSKCDAFGVQISGTVGLRFINNVVFGCRFSALLVRFQSKYQLTAPSNDAVIANNILDGFGLDHEKPAFEDYNLFTRTDERHTGAHDLIGRNPGFVNAAKNDYRLARRSIARRAGIALSPAGDPVLPRKAAQLGPPGGTAGVGAG